MVCEESPSQTTAPSPDLCNTDSPDLSPSSSAESNFRELDDAFLQTQTRIWLGEVLRIRLDEQLVISELLADGELLFLVSKVVWKLLLAKHMELRHIKAYKNQPFASMRNSGRYRPYSNVDSFLKVCEILGLTGIDLLSPSDVVERRNTRRVCMCIRSFSKKLRSKSIDVPDFDVVTCVVAMPKDLVGYIRRSIELSHGSPTDSFGYYLQKHSELQLRRAYSVTDSIRDWETYPDQSSDTEIKHPVHQFYDLLSDDELYNYSSKINHNVPSSTVDSAFVSRDLDQLDCQIQRRHGISKDELQLWESSQYHCSDNIEHACKFTWSSSPYCGASHIDSSGVISHVDTRVQENRITDFDYFENELLRDDASVIGTPLSEKMPAIVYKSASSHGSNSTPESTENGRCSEMDENTDPLHVSGMSCLSSKAEALNLEDQFDAENDLQNTESFGLNDDSNDRLNKVKEEHESHDIMKYKEMAYGITSNARYPYSVKELEETEHSLYSPDCFFCKNDSLNTDLSLSNDKKFLDKDRKSQVDLTCFDNTICDQSEELLSSQSFSLPDMCKWDKKGKCAMTSSGATDNKSSSGFSEDGSNEETTPCRQKTSDVLMTKVMSSCVPNKEDAVSEAVFTSDTDGEVLKMDSQPPASNALSVDDSKKCPTVVIVVDDANDFCGKEVTPQDREDNGSQGVLDLITKDTVFPANCYEDVSHKGPVYDSERTFEKEIRPENLAETEEGIVEIPKSKPQKKLLLKSVLGGAAAVGLIFMVLHLRGIGEEKDAQTEPSKAISHKSNENIKKDSPQKVKNRRATTAEGVYPAEKLKLK